MLEKISNSFVSKLSSPTSALRQVSLVAGGTVIAQMMNIIALPILSRIYSPADFGVMALYSSVVAMLTELAGLRYYLAIPLPKHTHYAHALVCLSFIIQVVVVAVITIVLFTCGDYIFKKLSLTSLIQYKYLLPIGVLAIGFYNVVSQWAIREALFTSLGKTKISQAFSGFAAKFILGILGIKPLGLIAGVIVGQAGGIGVLMRDLLRKKRLDINKKLMYRVMLRYRNFPIYNTWTGILNTFGTYMPQILLSSIYNIKFAGLYSMANSLLSVPAVFVGNAIGQVFLQKASVAKYAGNLPDLSFKSYILLLQIGVFPIIALSIMAPPLLTIVLGQQWAECGYYALVISPWIAYIFAVSHMANIFSILNLQKQALLFEICYVLVRIISFYLGKILFISPIISVLLFSLFNCLLLFFKMVYIFHKLSVSNTKLVFNTFSVIAKALVLSAFVWVGLYMSDIFIIIPVIIVTSALYIYLTYKMCKSFGLI